MTTPVALAADHGGFELKEAVRLHLEETGVPYRDFGSYTGEPCDYPDMAQAACRAVVAGECGKALLFCGTGVGISLAANKVPGIRAGVCSEPYTARMIVEHNNCQIVAMGARVVGDELAKAIVDAFFGATFQGGRHAERVQIIKDMEAELYKPEAL